MTTPLIVNNQRGHIHIFGAIILICLVIIFGPYIVAKFSGTSSREYIIQTDEDNATYYRDRSATGGKEIDSYLNVAVDQHTRLLRVKADAVVFAWNALDDESKRAIASTFEKELESQQAAISQFIKDVESPQWASLSMDKRKVRIQTFFDTMSLRRNRPEAQPGKTRTWTGSR